MISLIRKIMSGNRRRYPRIRTELEVALQLPNEPESRVVKTRNISASGMEILLNRPLEVLSEVDVEIRLPDQEDTLRLKGRLVRSLPLRTLWHKFRNQEKCYVIGINFLDLDTTSRSRIIRSLQQMTA